MKPVQSHTQNKLKPTAVVDYIGNVAGVDHSDQMVSYMPMHRKTIEWRKKTGLPLLTLIMIQAKCLYLQLRNQPHRKLVTLKNFAISVCYDLA